MKKWIFSLALMLSVSLPETSVQEMKIHQHDVVPQRFLPEDPDYVSVYKIQSDFLSVKGMQATGFPREGLQKLQEAFRVLELAVNSEEFKDRVINFKNSKGERGFASNNGLSNEEIYKVFMEGREILQPETTSEMNFYLQLYNRPWSKVIGYTNGDTNVIYVNWKYFKNFTPADVASNLAHEWTHKIGFDHKSAKEHDSAPYAIGYIAGDIASRLLKINKLH